MSGDGVHASSVDTVPVSVPISVPGQICRNFPVLRFLTVPNFAL